MIRPLFLLFAGTFALSAQEGGPAPGIVPPRPGPPAANGDAPDPDATTSLNLLNLTGQDIADLYHKYTGKRVLVSSEAAQAEISVVVQGELTYAEAARIIEQKLHMEGFALLPKGENLMVLTLAASPTSGAKAGFAPVVDEITDAGTADQFVTYVMPLEYLKPDEAMRAFQSVVQQFGPAGTVAAVPNAGSVVISGNRPLVKMLIELKNRIDVPSARVATKFVSVTYADVEDLADRLNEIFSAQKQSKQSARVQRTGATPAPQGAAPAAPAGGAAAAAAAGGGPGAGAGEETPIAIIAHPRTSRIFLMGRPVDLLFVEGLIRDFDAPSSRRNFLRRKLRYLPVSEFLPVAADALERTLSTGVSGSSGTRRTTRTTGSTTRPAQQNVTSRSRTSGSNRSGAGSGASQAGIMAQDFQTAPESLLVGKTLIVADNISNSVVVNGPPHHIEIVDELIEELDQPSEQVAISAVFGAYNIGEGRDFGVDFAQLFRSDDSARGGLQNRTGVPAVIDPGTLARFSDFPGISGAGEEAGAASSGLSVYGLVGDDFAVFVNALESNRNFRAMARPTVFTTNNGTARISSGSRIAVPTSTFQGGVSSGFSTNVEFRDIVLELEVRPLVNSEDEVTLEISLVRDDIGSDRFIQGFGNVPDIDTEEIATTVTVPNRSTIVLGGLIQESDTENLTGVPVLMSIPGVGRLFSRKTKEVERDELVIMIHPTIISNQGQLHGYQRTYDASNEVSERARGSVEGSLLPRPDSYVPVPASHEERFQPPRAIPVQEAGSKNAGIGEPRRAAPPRPARAAGVATSPMQRSLQRRP